MLAASPAIALLTGAVVSYGGNSIYTKRSFRIPVYLIICASLIGLAVVFTLIYYMRGYLPVSCCAAVFAPVLLIWSWRIRKSFPFTLAAAGSILILFVMGTALPTLDDRPLLKLAEKIETEFEEGDIVGVGSHVISHNRLSRYLGKKVKKVNVDLGNLDSQTVNSHGILIEFLTKNPKIFCVVTEKDYFRYVPEGIRNNFYIMAREEKWKKTNKIRFDKDLLVYFISGKRDLFINRVREEILLITNKEGI